MTSRSRVQKSVSQQQRDKGNAFYKSAVEDNFGPVVKRGRLESAQQCYKKALSCSNNGNEAASAAKNVAMATWRLASLHVAVEETEWKVRKELIERCFREAVEHFTRAYRQGASCKGTQWIASLLGSLGQCAEEIAEWLADLPGDGDGGRGQRVQAMRELVLSLPDCDTKAKLSLELATLLFHHGVTASEDQQFNECFRLMKECYFPIEEAGRLCNGDSDILREVVILREDVYLHTCIAESGMARNTGDSLLKTVTTEHEEVNFDLVWDIIDWYRQAAILCRTTDLEQEAIAYSRLGRVYGKVLSMSVKAKDCAKKAIELALSMSPRNFHGVDWYDESTKIVEDFQKRLNKEEEENKEKEQALSEMKEEMEELQKLVDKYPSVEEFLKTIYEKWPSKAPGAKLDNKLSKKKMLIRAISHYHPDKVNKEIHGNKWYYFSAEITKRLNKRYTQEKFCDSDD